MARQSLSHRDGWADRLGSLDAIGFEVDSACFLVGPFPGVHPNGRRRAQTARCFRRLDLLTIAALLDLRESTQRLGRWAADGLVWAPDLFRSAAFPIRRDLDRDVPVACPCTDFEKTGRTSGPHLDRVMRGLADRRGW